MSKQEEVEMVSILIRIITDEDFTQLKLPRNFDNLFNGSIPSPTDRVILINSSSSVTGRCDWVKMVKDDQDDLIFKDGWSSFVENNSLEFGDSILFEKSHQKFQLVFTIFRKTPSAANIQQQDQPITVSSDDSNHDSTDNDSDEEMSLDDEPITVSPAIIKSVITELKKSFLSPHPFFAVSLSQSYLVQLRIPLGFAKVHLLPESSESWTLLHGSGEDMRTFEIGIRYDRRRIWTICKGWSQINQATGLRKGDACAFELIDKDEMNMKISIFRYIGGKPGRVIEI